MEMYDFDQSDMASRRWCPIGGELCEDTGVAPGQPSVLPATQIVDPRRPAESTRGHPSIVDGDPLAYTNLFIAPLPKSVRNDDLLNVFLHSPFRASHASVMMDVNTGRSKGFGFVVFDDPRDGYAAVVALQGKCFVAPGGDTYTVNLSPSHHSKSACLNESRHVYFRNIPTALSAERVQSVLEQFGRIAKMQLRSDAMERWHMARVEYTDVQSAKAAVELGHGKALFPQYSTFPVMVKYADRVSPRTSKTRASRHLKRRSRTGGVAPTAEGPDGTEEPTRDVVPGRDTSMPEFVVIQSPGSSLREDPLHDSQADKEPSHRRTLSNGSSSSDSETGSNTSGSSGRYRRNPYDSFDVTVPVE